MRLGRYYSVNGRWEFSITGAARWPRTWGQAREWMRLQVYHRPDTVLCVVIGPPLTFVGMTDEEPHQDEVVVDHGTWMNGIWDSFYAHCQMKESA